MLLKSVLWLLEIGIGKALWNADKTVLENHTLTQAEEEKFLKHENNYAAVCLAFPLLSLAVFFGCIGSQAARFVCTLASLELRQDDALSEHVGLAQLSPSDSFQFGTWCCRQESMLISAALAKATVMCLKEAPSSLSSPTYCPHCFCASYYPGPADLLPQHNQLLSSSPFSPPSYASSSSSILRLPARLFSWLI